MSDRDAIEGFETVDNAECGGIFLQDTEPARSVSGVGVLVDAGGEFLLNNVAHFVVDTGRNRHVFLDPRSMRYGGDFDGGKEVGSERTAFAVIPSETRFVFTHEVVQEVDFGGKEEGLMDLLEFLVTIVSIAAGGGKRRGTGIKSWHIGEGIA